MTQKCIIIGASHAAAQLITSLKQEGWKGDVLVISDSGIKILRDGIGKYFELKESSIGPPDIYLGGKLREVTMCNGQKAWAFGSTQYVRAAVANVEEYLQNQGKKIPVRAPTPLSDGFRRTPCV